MTHDMEYDEKPTNTNVLFQLERLASLVGPSDTLIFFFSGHSISKEGRHYLLSVNSDPRSLATLETSSISIDRVRDILSKSKADQIVLLLDGCRNDPEMGRGDADNPLSKGFVDRLMFTGRPRQNFAVMYACSVGQRAYEWPQMKQGVFTYYLVKGFSGEAVDSMGKITVSSLAAYLQTQVSAWSQKHQAAGREQTPWLHMDGQPPMVLR
jgi:uncharacterized caspase-like protein